MWSWLLLGATFVIPFAVRIALIGRCQTPRWKANLAAIGFIPSIAAAGSVIIIASMSEQDRTNAGMALIFPLFVVGIPLVAAVVAVLLAEFMEAVS